VFGVGRRTVGRGLGTVAAVSGTHNNGQKSVHCHRQSRRSTEDRSDLSTTSWPQNAKQLCVSPSAAHSSALWAVSRILVTTSGKLILLPVCKQNVGAFSRGTSIPTFHCRFHAFSRHLALPESKMAATTTFLFRF